MSNYGPESQTPTGDFKRTCANCGQQFHTDSPRQKYCSRECKRAAQNARYYTRHRERIIQRVSRNQRVKRAMRKADSATDHGRNDPAA